MLYSSALEEILGCSGGENPGRRRWKGKRALRGEIVAALGKKF